ncbi:hypothetical protein FHS32_000501 [Streptomyces albaduncus]|uniref:Uncharacterized protein n=1 Tax=Streptomyces griseoloalbus TaxID=67303 RepID=A0A7W8BI20_9ACTN|nr:hypothetical protein [Streptomyces albaduncus]
MFSARISAPPGVVDWRSEYQSLTHERVTCPNTILGALARFLAGFGPDVGAFDFAVTADDACMRSADGRPSACHRVRRSVIPSHSRTAPPCRTIHRVPGSASAPTGNASPGRDQRAAPPHRVPPSLS